MMSALSYVLRYSGLNGRADGTNGGANLRSCFLVILLWAALNVTQAVALTSQGLRQGKGMDAWQSWPTEFAGFMAMLVAMPIAVRAWRIASRAHDLRGWTTVIGVGFVGFTVAETIGRTLILTAMMGLRAEPAPSTTTAVWSSPMATDLIGFAVACLVFAASRPRSLDAQEPDIPVQRSPLNGARAETLLHLGDGSRQVQVDVRDLIAVRAAGNYVELIFDGLPARLLRTTMKSAEGALHDLDFERVHKSWLVKRSAIEAFKRTAAGDLSLEMKGGVCAPTSRSNKKLLRQMRANAV